jgi:putative selenate reductase
MFAELERHERIFDLPARHFYLGDPAHDFSVSFHGHRASTALGPAAGPHTQLAQNLVLAWLGGSRIFELKTVQIQDELVLPRPCIDMRTVGLNAEWSQELKVRDSLREYLKGAMLIEMLRASGRIEITPGFGDSVFDMSVGYDLAGIRGDAVQAFLDGMRDAAPLIDEFRREIPASLRSLADVAVPATLSDSVTLSTFHGCPPHEIERIMLFLLRERGLHAIVKLNPTLLGPTEVKRLLHDVLGYTDRRVPDAAFARDTTWAQAVDIIGRLHDVAKGEGRGFGVKLTNTLIVENLGDFLPASETEVYLSGPPLHLLAMELVRRIRKTFGPDLPISFSAGIDRHNFADAVGLGLVPVTVCTDLLRKGGYSRLRPYHADLAKRMDAAGVRDVAGWVRHSDGARTIDALAADPRYAAKANAKPPKKIGRHLELFDCVTCDLCVPACPNDANFTFTPGAERIARAKIVPDKAGALRWNEEGEIPLTERHQIGVFADSCNECGNCDVFCPEDGGPFVEKPRFHSTVESLRADRFAQGFHVERANGLDVVTARFDGEEFRLEVRGNVCSCRGPGFRVEFDASNPAECLQGEAAETVDFTRVLMMDAIRRGILDGPEITWPGVLARGMETE